MTSDKRQALIEQVTNLQEEAALELVSERLAAGEDPLNIVQDCQEGLRRVGERYERREYFISGLIMAGEIFREVMELAQPAIQQQYLGSESGTILLGTVQGDIHDIGKSNLILLLGCYGFTVHDLGVDVPPERFLIEAESLHPDIIGLSGLLTQSFDAMHETVKVLRASDDAAVRQAPIIIGGSQLNEQVNEYIGADYWVTDAMSGVRLCQEVVRGKE